MSAAAFGLGTWSIREPGRPAIYRLAAGGLVNSLGSNATAVAFGFFLYDRTGSALWLSAWYFLSFGITGILTPVAGWLADRFDRRLLIVLSNVAVMTGMVWWIGRFLGGPVAGGLAAVIVAWHPGLLDEVRFGRCYGLVLLLSSLSSGFVLRWRQQPLSAHPL